MKLIDADLLRDICISLRRKYQKEISDKNALEYFKKEFEIYNTVAGALRAATCPTYTVIQTKCDDWIPCSEQLPETGVNVILTFKDTFHTHPSWPKVQVLPAWICNVDEENPRGQWAIEGRLGNYVIDIDDGIAWQPLPKPYSEVSK